MNYFEIPIILIIIGLIGIWISYHFKNLNKEG